MTIISRASIARQAQQDACDALAGHAVHNPYTPDTDAYSVWQTAFTGAGHEQAAEPQMETA